MRNPDPIEISLGRAERLADLYVDEHTCMECGKKVDYELIYPSITGDGPAICIECNGFDPFAEPL
jgi:hypothetical protein